MSFNSALATPLARDRQAVQIAISRGLSGRDRRRASRGRAPTEERFRALIEQAVGGVILADADGTIRYAGPSTQEILGYTPDELTGRNTFDLVHPEDVSRVQDAMSDILEAQAGTAYEYFRASHSSGDWRWLAVSTRNLLSHPQVGGLVFTFHDVSTRKQLDEEQASERLLFDKLTGLPNRALLEDRIERAILFAARANEPLGLLLLNIDRFKDVNDALGHSVGDEVLVMVAERLQTALRASDTFARLIGDEFVALLRCSDDESALLVAARIEAAMDEPFIVNRQPIALSATMGISFYPDHGTNGGELLQHADVALQNARVLNTPCAVYRSDEDEHSARRLGLRAELRDAIEQDLLFQYYQPKRTLKTGRVEGCEALVRWSHPAHGFVPPSEFIPVAEKWNAIKPLTLWALRTGIRQSAAWCEAGLQIAVAVNLSARDLHDRELPGAVSDLLTASALDPSLLVVEVTESMLMIDPDRGRFVLDQLRAAGVRISIDDFGTGYSSLAYLSRLPLDELKIDTSFVVGMAESEHNQLIVAATIDLGHRLGLTVTAEGVEDEGALEMLRQMNCDTVQGYFVSRPLAPDDLTRWMYSDGARQ